MMIVAHPDDEIIWGESVFTERPDLNWTAVVVTSKAKIGNR